MAYMKKDLSVLAYANGFTDWHYVTDDDLVAVTGKGYFNEANTMLRAGDVISVVCNSGGGISAAIVLVTKNHNGVVEISVMAKG